MTRIVLPPDIKLYSDKPIALVCDPASGTLVPDTPPHFPHFYIRGEDIWCRVSAEDLKQWMGGERLPAMATPEGLVVDTEWGPFGIIDAESTPLNEGKTEDLVKGIGKGTIAWDLKCPVMSTYSSLLGHLIKHYGNHTGGKIGRPGMKQTDGMRRNPLHGAIKNVSPEKLAAFEDRGHSLLDLACYHQQWALAEFLWTRGATWSDQALAEGRPLEALIVTSTRLRMGLNWVPNDALGENNGPERITWLQTWLDRYINSGGAINPEPALDWRMRLAVERGWQPDEPIIDSPAGLWIALFNEVGSGLTGMTSRKDIQHHAHGNIVCWARFWMENGVDLSQVRVSRGNKKTTGFHDFWKNTANHEAWVDLVDAIALEYQLDAGTAKANGSSRSMRL